MEKTDSGLQRHFIRLADVHEPENEAASLDLINRIFEPDKQVEMELDWPFRFSNMQQHSAQHLISAFSLKYYGWKTVGWHIGTPSTPGYIDFEGISPDVDLLEALDSIDKQLNEMILANSPVSVSIDQTREKYRGILMVDPLDGNSPFPINYCCGTHVQSLSQIQVIKLDSLERKGSSKHRLFFSAGRKALENWKESHRTVSALSKKFSCKKEELVENVEKIRLNLKEAKKEAAEFCEISASACYLIYKNGRKTKSDLGTICVDLVKNEELNSSFLLFEFFKKFVKSFPHESSSSKSPSSDDIPPLVFMLFLSKNGKSDSSNINIFLFGPEKKAILGIMPQVKNTSLEFIQSPISIDQYETIQRSLDNE